MHIIAVIKSLCTTSPSALQNQFVPQSRFSHLGGVHREVEAVFHALRLAKCPLGAVGPFMGAIQNS